MHPREQKEKIVDMEKMDEEGGAEKAAMETEDGEGEKEPEETEQSRERKVVMFVQCALKAGEKSYSHVISVIERCVYACMDACVLGGGVAVNLVWVCMPFLRV